MRTISKQAAGCAGADLSRPLQATGVTKVLGGILLLALLHNPLPAVSQIVSPGQSVTLAWTASTDTNVAGYNLYYGGASGDYTSEVSCGSATTATVSGLMPGATYYFAVTSYSFLGVESVFSAEVSYTVPGPPAGLQFSVTPAGQFVLTGTGLASQTYEIQATQDLQTWTVIGTVTVGAGGSLDFTDPDAPGFSSRFYRIQKMELFK
jgi:hypothetical protein